MFLHGRPYGIVSTMITTMDRAGRLVIPHEIRREAALEPGTPLEVRWRDGVIEIEPQPLEVTLERKGRLLVAKPAARAPVLRAGTVERTRRALAGRRHR
jgi:AbrB family looped-hinge helix DNA binding protein